MLSNMNSMEVNYHLSGDAAEFCGRVLNSTGLPPTGSLLLSYTNNNSYDLRLMKGMR